MKRVFLRSDTLILFLSLLIITCLIKPAHCANAILQLDSSNGTSSLFIHDSASTAVGTQVFGVDSDGNAVVVDNAWLGLGASAGRIQFDDTTTDAIGFLNYDVGIGTTNVNSGYLHLVGSGDAVLAVQSPDANSARINLFKTTTDNNEWTIYKPASSLNLFIASGTNNGMAFISGDTKVGIGTTNPATALEVNGNIIIASGSDIRPTADSTSAINIATSAGSDWVTFDTINSRVGIGLTGVSAVPKVDLHLIGQGAIAGSRNTDGKGWTFFANNNSNELIIIEYTQAWGTGWSGSFRHSFLTGTGYICFQNTADVASYDSKNSLDVIGNLSLGNTAAGSNATRTLVLVNGAAPTTSPVDSAQLYAQDVSSSSELFVMDESGNATQKSPHDPLTGEWIFYSKNIKTGRVVRVEMEKFVKAAEELTGEKFMTETWEGPKQE